jgi:predicted dienelactone hydrolase
MIKGCNRFGVCVFVSFLVVSVMAVAQENRIDVISSDAPILAKYGDYPVGVRTLVFTDSGRVDVLNTTEEDPPVVYDRSLTVEIWYPAHLREGEELGEEYEAITRNPKITATLIGQALREAAPAQGEEKFPLIVISHGYPGNRYLLSPLGENLASKGYVVVSIDHKDSTYEDQQHIKSTFYNRPLDQRFIIDSMGELNSTGGFLSGMIDMDNTGVVGYSMGGFGLVNNLGGGFNEAVVNSFGAPPQGLLAQHVSTDSRYRGGLDGRIKAGFAIAPWGMERGFWNESDLAGISVPTFYLAGSKDTTAGYENGVRAIFEAAINSERYLLTYVDAGHNAGAPYPVPAEILASETREGADHYSDPVWDNVRMNNIMNHFATAYFNLVLKRDRSMQKFLDVIPRGDQGKYSKTSGAVSPEHNYWEGFPEGSASGLILEKLEAIR